MKNVAKNTVFNVLGNGIAKLAPFFALPMFLSVYGAEGIAIIGLYSTLLQIVSTFYSGLMLQANRELAKSRNYQGKAKNNSLANIKHLEKVFFSVVFVFGVCILLLLGNFSHKFIENLSHDKLTITLAVVALIFYSPILFYESCLTGLLKFGQNNLFLAVFEFVRWGGGVIIALYFSKPISYLFGYIAIVSAFQVFVMRHYFWLNALGGVRLSAQQNQFNWNFLGYYRHTFIITMFTMLVTQIDKYFIFLNFEGLLIGVYFLVQALGRVLYVLTFPISNAFFSYSGSLLLNNEHKEFLTVYKNTLQIHYTLMFPAVGTLFFFSEEVLLMYTGDNQVAIQGAFMLKILSLTTLLFSVLEVQKAPQLAAGNTAGIIKMYLIASVIFSPIIWLVGEYYSLNGILVCHSIMAGYCVIHSISVLSKSLPGQKIAMTFLYVTVPYIGITTATYFFGQYYVNIEPNKPVEMLVNIFALALVCILGSLLTQPNIRSAFIEKVFSS